MVEGKKEEKKKSGEGLGTASLVLGIISLVLSFTCIIFFPIFLVIPLALVGLILGIVNKAKKGKKGMKEIHALVERKTYNPISLRIKVAFIWTTIKISNFKSGGITDEMLRFPKEQFKDYKFEDKR